MWRKTEVARGGRGQSHRAALVMLQDISRRTLDSVCRPRSQRGTYGEGRGVEKRRPRILLLHRIYECKIHPSDAAPSCSHVIVSRQPGRETIPAHQSTNPTIMIVCHRHCQKAEAVFVDVSSGSLLTLIDVFPTLPFGSPPVIYPKPEQSWRPEYITN